MHKEMSFLSLNIFKLDLLYMLKMLLEGFL